MRKIAVFFVFVFLLFPAFAAKKVTVEQLQQAVTALHAKPDVEAARAIAEMELTERLNPADADRLAAGLQGEETRRAVAAVADASAFLDPPPAEIPARPAPDVAAQRQMLALTVAYVGKTIPQLPNFFATRGTTQYEDTPQIQKDDFFIPYQPLHRVAASNVTMLYRDGQEAIDTGSNKKPPPMSQGLNTRGVFGPILATVLLDAAQSKLNWSHWEQGPAGMQAVFAFEVPKEKSHYEVNYCCVATEAATVVANMHPYHRIVGYRGKMTIDPGTGSILRLVVEADLKTGEPVTKAAIMVEYGSVEIGGKTYICPVKSVSSAVGQSVQLDPLYKFPLANQLQPLKHSLSDARFDQYHVFRAEAQVVTAESGDTGQGLPGVRAVNTGDTASAGQSPEEARTPAAATAEATPTSSAPEEVAATPRPAEATSVAAPIPSSEPAVPEITVGDANSVPDMPANNHPSASDSGFTLHTTARLVDVGVVAFDKKGHPVTDLKPEDFELYDNGRKQEVRYYSQAGAEAAVVPPAQPDAASSANSLSSVPGDFSNRRATANSRKTAAAESNITVLMIDAGNIAWGDLSYARSEMMRFLKGLPENERVGIYIMKSYNFEVLQEASPDHAQLLATLGHWMPAAQDLSRAQDEEQRNRQHFDWVHSIYDLQSVNGNGNTASSNFSSGKGDLAQAAAPTDPKLLSMGSNPARDSFFILAGVARHLAAIPGHKSLVWVSSDNVLADWSNQAAARQDKGSSKFIDQLALRAQEALNDAHVSVYPLDTSQLEAAGVTADLGNRNITAMGFSDRDKATAAAGDAAPGFKPGRQTAQMQQDTHGIQGAIRDLADATGGRVFRRSGEIANELDSVVADGRAAWLLSFTPDQPADDKYHLITVKLATRRDLTLRFRNGYQYDKEPATMKDRFRQAVWRPADLTEIALTAHAVPATKEATIQLRIAATDLGLAQQAETWSGKLDVFLIQRDDAGLHAQVTGQQLGLRLKPATYQRMLSEGVPFEVKVAVRPDTTTVRVVAVDENSGRIGSVTIPAAELTAKR
ncbi:MAG: VWA domain-containing protein [Terracidiphilus sp.]